MLARLPWQKIVEAYCGEWVELIQYRWDLDAPFPKWGVVRNHHSNRSELLASVNMGRKYPESLILHIQEYHPLVRREETIPAL